MLFTDAHGRAVMDLTTAETVGTVATCTVAPSPARIAGVRLKTRGRTHHTLDWQNIRSFGPDAVVVEDSGRIRDEKEIAPADHAHATHDPVGKAVLTETGHNRGAVLDIEFDEQTGLVSHLLTEEERIPGGRLLGVGSYAVVVTAPP
ncbi:PRC-barrel domain-containing protein [Streptomyces sp. TRM49041]|uniref:PRC-barrel domain-containing protein n=1 Tax=Streptomyces sp. TRM49041 TaxID=2603216 RepID=UPI0011EED43E|nr:PRC-barrel domain-containing protein [Streptomyces sp. TRM49041]